jgi:hypothetical protein
MKILERLTPTQLFSLIAILFGCALFAINHDVPFVYDDSAQIMLNPNIKSGLDWQLLISDPHRPHRLVQNVTLAIDWLVSGPKPWAFHLSNDLVHVICSCLLFSLLPILGLRNKSVHWFASLLFLIHPLQIEATTYIMGRVDLHRMLATLILLHLYLRAQRPRLLIYVLLVVSLVIKENITLTCVLFLVVDLVIKQLSWHEVKWREHLFYLSHVVWLVFWSSFLNFKSTAATIGFDLFPFWDYVVSNFHYAWFYVVLFLNPLEQSLYHDWVATPSSQSIALGLCFLLGLLVGFFYWLRRQPVVSFMIFFYALSYLPNNSFLQFINPFAECRLYQSNAAMAFLMASALFSHAKYLRIKYVVAASLIVYFLAAHYVILGLWNRGALVLWSYAEEKYPAAKIPNMVMASHYLEIGQCTKAIKHFELACTNFPHPVFRGRCDSMMALAYFYKGNRLKAQEIFNKLLTYPMGDRSTFYYTDGLTLGNRLGKPEGYEKLFAEAEKKIPFIKEMYTLTGPPSGSPCVD